MSEENQVSEETISEARSQGWVPLEEFRDSEDRWVDAETFVKRGREINPILRKHNAELKKEVEKAKAAAAEAIESAKEFKEFQKTQFEKQKADLQKQIAELKAQKKQAVTDGDGERVVDIDDAIDALKEEQSTLAPPKEIKSTEQPTQIDPLLQSWLDKNEWFGQDQVLTRRTNGIGAALRAEFPDLKGQAFLDLLDKEIQETFADKFKKREKPVSSVEGGSTTSRPSKSGKKTYADLPSDAKAACDKFIKQGLYKADSIEKSRAAYVADYFEGE